MIAVKLRVLSRFLCPYIRLSAHMANNNPEMGRKVDAAEEAGGEIGGSADVKPSDSEVKARLYRMVLAVARSPVRAALDAVGPSGQWRQWSENGALSALDVRHRSPSAFAHCLEMATSDLFARRLVGRGDTSVSADAIGTELQQTAVEVINECLQDHGRFFNGFIKSLLSVKE